MRKTKLHMVLDIVNWEHRYRYGRLESGGWCIERIRELMHFDDLSVRRLWLDTSGQPYFFKVIGQNEED